ncbi:hypothetical protein CR513_18116, partial [Mucuna pruriens]
MEGNTHYHIRKLQPVPTKTPDVQSLRHWGSQLKGQWWRAFERKYKNLLSLVNVEVQPAALSALTQYYDLPLRCFTFKGFQLAPTLEEYKRLLGMPLERGVEAEEKPKWSGRDPGGSSGGESPTALGRRGLADLLLFPQIKHYVDFAAIDAFLGKRDRGEHPVVAILANTYCTLDFCSTKKGKGLKCYTSLLFLWLIAHLFHSSKKTRCLIKDHHWSCIRPLTKVEWTSRLDEATEKSICWYPQWNEREDVIIQSRGFPNIPLMST